MNRINKYHARLLISNDRIGLAGIVYAYELGFKTLRDVADVLKITEASLCSVTRSYKKKYGDYTIFNDYIIYFTPNLRVGRIW